MNKPKVDKFDTLSDALRFLKGSNGLIRLKLDRAQLNAWQESRAAMLFSAPMFSHIFYELLLPDNKDAREHLAFFTDKVPTAATDGFEIFINPPFFFALTLPEKIFVLAHEVMHPVLNHNGIMYMCHMTGKVVTSSGKALPYNATIMNMAMDYVINHMLVVAKIGKMPTGCCYDPTIGTMNDSCIDVYEKLWKKMGGKCPPPPVGPPGGMGGDVLMPGAGQGDDPQTAINKRPESQVQTAVAAAAASAKAQGKLPAEIEQMFGAVLEPKVSWSDHIKSFFARKVGSGAYDWDKPDEEFIVRGLGVLEGQAIYAPGPSGHGAGTVVVGMDSSGSIYCDPTLIDRWMAELSGILEDVRPKRIVVIWCDAKVHRVDEVEDSGDLEVIRAKGAKGGGGTSFVPVFEEIKDMGLEPDALVYLTDGDGTFPRHAPAYPVLWGNITQRYENSSHYPFGEVVTVPVDQ